MRNSPNPLNFHTRIQDRAISADASLVSQVALIYSQSLEDSGVIPTVKHFPGLGRIREDTHHFQAELDVSRRELQRQDWRPFRDDFTMGPIYRGKHGIGNAAVSALNAGVDLVLISYDGEKYYDAMYAVIQADRHQYLDTTMLQRSEKRLERVINEVLNL